LREVSPIQFVKTLALTLTLSPKEREQQATLPDKFERRLHDYRSRIAQDQRNIPPLLGERAGVRENN